MFLKKQNKRKFCSVYKFEQEGLFSLFSSVDERNHLLEAVDLRASAAL